MLPRADAEHCAGGRGEGLHSGGGHGFAHRRKNDGDEGEVEEGTSILH